MTRRNLPRPDDSRYCGARTRSGTDCKRPAGWGTSHVGVGACKLHGGATPNALKHAQKIEAERAVVTFGLPREVDPHEALLEELHRTAGHVMWLGQVVAEFEHHGLYQWTEAGKRPDVFVEMYQAERKHLAAVAVACAKAGIEERRTRLAEEQGELLAKVIRGILADFGLAADPRAPEIVRRHLALVQAG